MFFIFFIHNVSFSNEGKMPLLVYWVSSLCQICTFLTRINHTCWSTSKIQACSIRSFPSTLILFEGHTNMRWLSRLSTFLTHSSWSGLTFLQITRVFSDQWISIINWFLSHCIIRWSNHPLLFTNWKMKLAHSYFTKRPPYNFILRRNHNYKFVSQICISPSFLSLVINCHFFWLFQVNEFLSKSLNAKNLFWSKFLNCTN